VKLTEQNKFALALHGVPICAVCNKPVERMERTEQEPVAWVKEDVCEGQRINGRPRKIWWECEKGVGTAFYTHPPQRTEQEPEAWMYQEYRDDDQFGWRDEIQFVQPPNDPNYFRNIVPVYTHPTQRTWVDLTCTQMHDVYFAVLEEHRGGHQMEGHLAFALALQAKLKEKNT
jgi:hypothetical protein